MIFKGRGTLDVPQPASDGGLAKGVGAVLNQNPPAEPPKMIVKKVPLPWDRKPWGPKLSEHLRELLRKYNYASFVPADIHLFTYKYEQLPDDARIEFWAHFWSKLAWYECSYDPKQASVDAGKKGQINTYSVGMLQMSVIDQESYRLRFGFEFDDLQDPFKNLILAMPIGAGLLKEDGRICGFINGHWRGLARYWGTMRDEDLHNHREYSYKPMIAYMQSLALAEYPMPEPAPAPILKGQVPRGKKLGIVVGHDSKERGARLFGKDNYYEYDYNKEVAAAMFRHAASVGLAAEINLRDDGAGIAGAYQASQDCDVVIELHFNSYNGKVQGTEVLCSSEEPDKQFAAIVQDALVNVFDRHRSGNRGIKTTDSGRGAQSCTSFRGKANCLVEPFFGDNPADAKMGLERREIYARTLVECVIQYLNK